MDDIFGTCVTGKAGIYSWNEWRILTSPDLLLPECKRISEEIGSQSETGSAICILCRSGLPLLPTALYLRLPFFLYNRRRYTIGGIRGAVPLLPYSREVNLKGRIFFLLDTTICKGRVMMSAKEHLEHYGAKCSKGFVLMSYCGIEGSEKMNRWCKRQVKSTYSLSDKCKILDAIEDNRFSEDDLYRFPFWNVSREFKFYKYDIPKESKGSTVVKVCGSDQLRKSLMRKACSDGEYINVEAVFSEPELLLEMGDCIAESVSLSDYNVICGMSDVAMPLVFAILMAADSGIRSNIQIAYIGRTLSRYGSLVWPDTLDLKGKRILLVDNKIRSGDAAAFSYQYLIQERAAHHCDIAIILEYGDPVDKEYFGFLGENNVKIYSVVSYSSGEGQTGSPQT